MNVLNNSKRFGSLSIGLHWLMLLLLIAVYACIELREIYPKGSDTREALKNWHFMLGLMIFPLAIFRLGLSITSKHPQIEPRPPKWQNFSAIFVHSALYVLMVAMPILGWLLLSASGKTIPFFGINLPALLAKNKEVADLIKEIHALVGTIGYFLIGLHTIASLFHHYYMHDNTFKRMLPSRE
jgi:cytochrome b561